MRKFSETDMVNCVLTWLSNHVEKETFRLQHSYSIKFIAMGHGWCEFDLHRWDGSKLYMEAWVDREETELTFTNRNYDTASPTELTFLNVMPLT